MPMQINFPKAAVVAVSLDVGEGGIYRWRDKKAGELGIHGITKGKSGTWRLAQLVRRAGCFVMWVEVNDNDDDNDNLLLQFASPLYKSDDTLQNG